MREHVIERYLCRRVEEADGLAIKFTSSGNRGVPDRMCVLPGAIIFVELKAPGKHPNKLQKTWINLFKALGHPATWVDSRPKVDALMLWYERFVDKDSGVDIDLARKLIKILKG